MADAQEFLEQATKRQLKRMQPKPRLAETAEGRQIQALTGELEAFDAVRERYPTLDWQDFDGAVLIHSSHNTMKNQLAVLEWNRTEIMRGRRLADRLRLRWPAARETALNTHTAHHAQVTFADGIQTIPRSDSAHTACKTAEVCSLCITSFFGSACALRTTAPDSRAPVEC